MEVVCCWYANVECGVTGDVSFLDCSSQQTTRRVL